MVLSNECRLLRDAQHRKERSEKRFYRRSFFPTLVFAGVIVLLVAGLSGCYGGHPRQFQQGDCVAVKQDGRQGVVTFADTLLGGPYQVRLSIPAGYVQYAFDEIELKACD